MKTSSASTNLPCVHLRRLVLVTAVILLIPLVAMQFSSDVNWGREDFITIGILVFGIGLLYELIARKLPGKNQRLTLGIALVLVLLYIWAELAVGIFTHLGS